MASGQLQYNGVDLVVGEAWIPDPSAHKGRRVGNLALLRSDVATMTARGQNTVVAQLEYLLLPNLLLSRHVFRGLRRPLLCDGDRNGEKSKLIYSRKPAFDVLVTGSAATGFKVTQRPPPDARVFCAIVSPNVRHRDQYPMVDGWLDHWNWVPEDSGLPEAPSGWIDRYDERVFTILDSERLSE